jgi:photosystem II stability/assembly factor-like uncharacterized protein
MNFRWLVVACAMIGLISAAPMRALGQSPAQAPDRDEKIKQLEKTLQELQKQIDEIKKGGGAVAGNGLPAMPGGIPAEWTKQMNWRSIGPGSMGGRIVDLAVYEADPMTFWVATASGGLLKTENNGVTFEHQFDHEATVSIGAVAVAQSDKNIVWVGTGENNPRNSVSYGDGVYKSTDGGKSWKNMGLKKTFQIGRIIVHPKDPSIVYVGALGRLYGPNEDRGLFKTTDGGATWQKVLYVDDKTGVIDMIMKPGDPETLIVATWERQRDGFDSHRGEPAVVDGYDAYDPIKKWGPGSGLHKTTDGGKTFKKLTNGLPASHLGRVGLDWYRKDPNVVYAVIDCAEIGKGSSPPPAAFLGIQGQDSDSPVGAKITQVVANTPAEKAGLKANDIVVAAGDAAVVDYFDLTESLRGKRKDEKLKLKVLREQETVELEASLEEPRAGPQGGGGGGQGQTSGRFALMQLLGALPQDTENGVRIVRVSGSGDQETPAQKAGIAEGDIVKAVDAKETETIEKLLAELREKKPDVKIAIAVERDVEGKRETKQLSLTLEGAAGGTGPGTRSRTRPNSYNYGGQAPNIQRHQGEKSHEYGGVYRSADGGETWTRINSLNPRPMYFSLIRVDPQDEKFIYLGGVQLHKSKNGGKTFTEDGGAGVVHPDQHAMWINPKDGRNILVGCDGGFYVTYDRMAKWDFLNHAAIGQFYHVTIDSKQPYWVYGGLQDNGTWGGPAFNSRSYGPVNEEWIAVAGGDGFVVRVDPFDSDLVYYESQDGNMAWRNLRTGERGSIRPRTQGSQGSQGSQTRSASEGQTQAQTATAGQSESTGQAAPTNQPSGPRYRWNWNTPFILSNHNPGIFYAAGNYVFRSVKRGDDLKPISPEIARTGRGTGTAIAESPRNPDVLYVGTDDGNLWVTRDGGTNWTNVADKIGLPGPRWVSTIEPSRFVDGRVYVTFDAHRSDDDEPYVYASEDYGQKWTSLRANLPWGSTRVLREDTVNRDLLFCGTEFGLWASVDRGKYWTRLNNNLPTVAVHEVAIHPANGEIVVATHGRSLWALDISALRQMTPDIITAKMHLYQPNTVVRLRPEPSRQSAYGTGHRRYYGTNPPRGAQIHYSLTEKAEKASIKIIDYAGRTLRELPGKTEPGLHVVAWDLRVGQSGPGGGIAGGGGGPPGVSTGGGGRGGAGRSGRGGSSGAPAGTAAATEQQPATGGQAAQPTPATGEPPAQTSPTTPPREGAAPAATSGSATQSVGAPQPGPGASGSTGQQRPSGPASQGQPRLPTVLAAGMYRVVLTIDGQEFTTSLKIEGDITQGGGGFGSDDEEQEEGMIRAIIH